MAGMGWLGGWAEQGEESPHCSPAEPLGKSTRGMMRFGDSSFRILSKT